MNPKLQRQFDLIPENVLGEEITIIGAGAIGSWTCLALAKMGFANLRVYDFDTVSIENMNSQLYPETMLGYSKIRALANLTHMFTGVEILGIDSPWENQIHSGIIIAAVDSMAVRQQVYDCYSKPLAFRTRAVIDPRMGAENALLYVYKPGDKEDRQAYAKSLYTDEKAVPEPCTAKATIYTANLISGLVCKAVKDLVTGRPNYLRSAQWNIRDNELFCFERKV